VNRHHFFRRESSRQKFPLHCILTLTIRDLRTPKHLLNLAAGNRWAALGLIGLMVISPLTSAANSLPRAGLIMHLDASVGVAAPNGPVTHWYDQSGYGQNLTASGSPRRIPGRLNGRTVIELDTAADSFRQRGTSSLPSYEHDRTLLVLSAPIQSSTSIGWGGRNGCNQRFAIHHDKQGYSALATGCPADLMHAQTALPSGQWRLNVLVVKNGVLYHLRDGSLVDARTERLATAPGPFSIASDNTNRPRGRLQIAAVLGYNWALGSAELKSLHAYLGSYWFGNTNQFAVPPDLSTIQVPNPKIQLTQRKLRSGGLEVSWRASYAQACTPNGNWTNSSATSGKQLIRTPIPGSLYAMDCWTPTASSQSALSLGDGVNRVNSASGGAENVRLKWQPAANTGQAVVAYRLYISTSPGRFDRAVRIPANPQNEHSLDLQPGRYYLAMASINSDGQESRVSGELGIVVD